MQYIYTCTITYPAESGLDSVITTLKCLLSAAFKIRPVTTRDTPCTSIVVSSWIKPSPSSAILDRACSDISAKRSPRRNNSSLQDLKSCYKRYLALFRNIQYIHTHIKINLHTRTIYMVYKYCQENTYHEFQIKSTSNIFHEKLTARPQRDVRPSTEIVLTAGLQAINCKTKFSL